MAEDYSEYLAKTMLFENASPATLRALSAGCRIKTYKADEHLFFEHDPGGSMVVILDGQVSIERNTDDDDRDEMVQIALRGPGETIGELSIFADQGRTADARATVKTRTLILDGRYLLEYLNRDSHLSVNIISALCEKLRQSMDRHTAARTDTVRTKLAKAIIDAAKQFGEKQPNGEIILREKLTQRELAQRVGCTREAVNRALSELVPDALEFHRGRITIRNRRAIKRWAKA